MDVFHDPESRGGSPLKLGQGNESQPVMTDLQGTGKLGLVYGDASGILRVLDRNGHELTSWPVQASRRDLLPARQPAGKSGAAPPAFDPAPTSPAAVGDLEVAGAEAAPPVRCRLQSPGVQRYR